MNENPSQPTNSQSEKTNYFKWHWHQSVIMATMGKFLPSSKVAAYDLDGTLITTNSKNVFPKNRYDWKFFDESLTSSFKRSDKSAVVKKLREAHDNGSCIVIFTNQKGVTTGSTKLSDLTGKVEDIHKILAVPFVIFVLTSDDEFRKPRTGAWNLLKSKFNDINVDLQHSYFVGDAAGRVISDSNSTKDHSDSDVKFALNIGLQFYTPDQHFIGVDEVLPFDFKFDPRLFQSSPIDDTILHNEEEQEVILLVGPPAAGKTTLCKRYFTNYEMINQDNLLKRTLCEERLKVALSQGKSCVVDCLNRDRQSRRNYIQIAKEKSVSVRAVLLKVPKELCFHLNSYRSITKSSEEKRRNLKVPPVVIHSYYKYIEEPERSEGFNNIKVLNMEDYLPGPFKSSDDEKLFRSFLT